VMMIVEPQILFPGASTNANRHIIPEHGCILCD